MVEKAIRPAVPEWLGDLAAAEWARVVDRLEAAGVLADVEAPAIEAYCRSYETYRNAESWIAENGLTTTYRNEKGVVRIYAVPHVGISKGAAAQMRQFWTDCGLTPASVGKVERAEVAGGDGMEPTAEDLPEESVDEQRARILARIG